jgi:hypothetical protein
MTAKDIGTMLDEFRVTRDRVVNDVSLFLVGQDEERVAEFMKFWNDRLEREFLAMAPVDRSFFIWKIIDDAARRVREIERTAVSGSAALN